MNKFYPNLNTLRFIAASLVIIFHIELHKSFYGLPNLYQFGFFQIIGKLGVVLFFVLSGFLITSLLLNEKEHKGHISVKNFYIRRILRIWPLYYLVVLLAFYVFPHISILDHPDKTLFPSILNNTYPNIFLYLTIFANLAVVMFGEVLYGSQTWSIATEEQFYLFWPLLFVIFKKTNRLFLFVLLIIAGYWSAEYLFEFTHIPEKYIGAYSKSVISGFLHYFLINCMAIGASFAFLVHFNSKILKFVFNHYFFIASVIFTCISLICGIEYGFFHFDIYSLFFAIIITNLACNPRYSTVLENSVTNYLGTISYGVYMLHSIFLTATLNMAVYFQATWFIYPAIFISSFAISHLSYKYFELYFLRLKSKFM